MLRILDLRCVLVSVLLLLERRLTVFVRGLVLKCNLVGLVLGIEGHLSSFVEHVIVYTRGDVEKIDLLSLIET